MNPFSIYTAKTDDSKLRRACLECDLVDMCFPKGVATSDRLHMKSKVFRAGPYYHGELVFRKGDRFFAIYAVREGSVKNVFSERNGRERIIGFNFPGEVFGFEAIANGVYPNDCVALETTTLCALPFDAVQEFSLRYPHIFSEFIRLMSREMLSQTECGLAAGAKKRLAAFLLSASMRLKNKNTDPDCITLSMTRQDIAYHLGIAPETLSRLFADMEKNHVLAVQGKSVQFLNRKRLEALID